jgi:prepilin-type N-terminal cleavage/methylation domain-containing protein/prepilin-type processing-associated H-X9-DG protein
MHTHTKTRGFTLIELLVVIAIIMILAAILFPVFDRAMQNAERASCQSNLKQIGLAFKQYTQDYDDKYPKCHYGQTNNPGRWISALEPYYKSSELFACPGAELTAAEPYSYAFNDSMEMKKEAQVSMATLVVLNWEQDSASTYNNGCSGYQVQPYGPYSNDTIRTQLNGTPFQYGQQNNGKGCIWPAGKGASLSRNESIRHLEGSNYSFVDGHVKWFKPDGVKLIVDGQSPTFWAH